MRLIYKTTDLGGKTNTAELEDAGGRRFQWSRRVGVSQWIEMPVANEMGYGDGYWRGAGRRDAEAVTKALETLGLIESRHQRHARLACEAIGF